MAHIEEAYVIPAHTTTQHNPQTKVEDQIDGVAGISNTPILNTHIENVLNCDVTAPDTYVIKLPTGGGEKVGLSDSSFSIEWISQGKYMKDEQIPQFYPATAIVGFAEYTSKTVGEWFIEAAVDNQTEDSQRLKIGDKTDEQDKYVVIPTSADPTWVQQDDQFILVSQFNNLNAYGQISDRKTEYTSTDSFSTWCRYDNNQNEWVVYPDENQQLRYDTKQEFKDNWQFITLPETPRTQQREYTLDASNIGEIGLPHKVDEIAMARDIYKNAKENWDGPQEAAIDETTTTESRGQQAGWSKTAELKNTINEIARSEKELCMIDPKGDMNEQLVQQLPASISDDITLIDAKTIDKETLAAVTLLEPNVDEDHPRYDEEVETIVSNLTEHMEIDKYWGPRMLGIVKSIIQTMIENDKIYTPKDLYDILIKEERREEFIDSIIEESMPTGAKEDVLLTDDIKVYTKRMDKMDDIDIDPVIRRLQNIVEEPHRFGV
jgi:hypothetical protein